MTPEYYQANKEKIKAQTIAWQKANPERVKEIDHKRYLKNKEAKKSQVDKWRIENKDKKYEMIRRWREAHPDQWKAICKNKNIRRKRCVAVQVISYSYTKEINAIYRNCPDGHHVDHIVPLRGKLVSGLHVPWNLQYLPAEVNIKKSNRLDSDY